MAAETSKRSHAHPLQPLTEAEITKAREVVVKDTGSDSGLFFRAIQLQEPNRDELTVFLEAEHAGKLSAETAWPSRHAIVIYDVIKSPKEHLYTETVVDLTAETVVGTKNFPPESQTSFLPEEFGVFTDACVNSDLFKDAIKEFSLPENFTITIDPWPYGGLDPEEKWPRLMQGLVFARDHTNNNLDSNHYGYPIPIIPVMDLATRQLIRVDRLATGGKGESLFPTERGSEPRKLFEKNKPAEYVPELLGSELRTDLKPINITQPEGASFKVHADNLVEWSKWRFRLGFTTREGAVLHDVTYDNRPIMYRLSFSEMTVPYGDPRPPFHRKQAFDFGDGGCGRTANNLELGCDCLGNIHYFDALLATPEGKPSVMKNVVCLHEQDNGIGWKHTNFRTNRAIVTRLRELVVQFIVTLANYEYIFAYKLDTAGGITVETRATGIVSVVGIDEGKTSGYGNVVSPGVLAQNHQHIFAVRADPSIDSYSAGDTQVVLEESHPIPQNEETNPYGNGYEIKREAVKKPRWADAEPKLNRVVRLESATKKNEISGKNVGYKLIPYATQLMLADPKSTQAARAPFAQHHLWVTGYRDGELWAAGDFTNQTKKEVGGVKTMVERGDWFVDEEGATNGHTNGVSSDDKETAKKSTPVLWTVFALTHNPRVEDWPVMPVEIHQLHFRPADFFTKNPALDIPGNANKTSTIVSCCDTQSNGKETGSGSVQQDPLSHLQGSGPDIDPKKVGAGENGENGVKEKRRLSTTLASLVGFGKKKE